MRPVPRPSSFTSLAPLAAVMRENAELKRLLAAKKAEKTDDEHGDDVTDDNKSEDNEAAEDEGDDAAEIAEKKRKKKLRESLVDDDESTSPPHDPADESAASAHWARIFAQAPKASSPEAILNGVRWRGVLPPAGSSLSQTAYQQFVATGAAMVLHAARMARGAVNPPLPPRGSVARAVLNAHYKALGREMEID